MAYEPIATMKFDPEDGLNNTGTYVEKPATQEIARENIQRGMNQIRDFINNNLVWALYRKAEGSSGADQIGSYDGTMNLGADTVYGQLAAMKVLLDNVVAGVPVIADGSIVTAKLADGSVTLAKLSADAQIDDFDGGTVTQNITIQNTAPGVVLDETGGVKYYLVADGGNFSIRLALADANTLWPLYTEGGVLKTKGNAIWHNGNLAFGVLNSNMARGDHTHASLVAGTATDTVIGNRTVTDTTTPVTTPSALTAILGMFGYMIKAITGEASWITAPDATIASIVSTNTAQQTSINTLNARIANKITVGTVAPTAPTTNDLWVDIS